MYALYIFEVTVFSLTLNGRSIHVCIHQDMKKLGFEKRCE